jgi:hypothetical protein
VVSARVIDEPLAVAFAFSDATSYTLSLHHLPCPALVRDLARGLAAMAHPHGDVDARNRGPGSNDEISNGYTADLR